MKIEVKGEVHMVFTLIKPTIDMEKQYNDYINEWENTCDRIVPYAIRRAKDNFEDLIVYWEEKGLDKVRETGFSPSSLYFFIDENKRIYGSVDIRHELTEYLFNYGGHIGYGIRPSERKKGYATTMLSLALPIAKELGIEKLLITCSRENIGSAKTIRNNGGVLENEVIEDGEVVQRYWIEI